MKEPYAASPTPDGVDAKPPIPQTNLVTRLEDARLKLTEAERAESAAKKDLTNEASRVIHWVRGRFNEDVAPTLPETGLRVVRKAISIGNIAGREDHPLLTGEAGLVSSALFEDKKGQQATVSLITYGKYFQAAQKGQEQVILDSARIHEWSGKDSKVIGTDVFIPDSEAFLNRKFTVEIQHPDNPEHTISITEFTHNNGYEIGVRPTSELREERLPNSSPMFAYIRVVKYEVDATTRNWNYYAGNSRIPASTDAIDMASRAIDFVNESKMVTPQTVS